MHGQDRTQDSPAWLIAQQRQVGGVAAARQAGLHRVQQPVQPRTCGWLQASVSSMAAQHCKNPFLLMPRTRDGVQHGGLCMLQWGLVANAGHTNVPDAVHQDECTLPHVPLRSMLPGLGTMEAGALSWKAVT